MQGHPGGCPDGWGFLEAVSPVQLPSAADRQAPCEWDAWVGAHPAATADGPPPDLPDAGAEKSADRELDAPAQGGSQ